MVRTCDQCGHNSTTCDETNRSRNNGAKVLLFGVDLMQKQNNTNSSNSNNASAVNTDASSFVNDGISRTKHESKGIPWTEEEHLAFLAGLKEVGRGEWKRISMEFVKTRTSTQVASHAQKYFLRSLNQKKKKRRSSIFDTPLDNHNSVILEHNPQTDWCTTTASKPKAQEFNQIIPNLGLGLGYSSSVNPVFPNHGRIPYMGGVIGRTRPEGYVQVMNYGRLGYAYIPNFYNNAHAPFYSPQALSMVSQQADGHGSSTLVAKDVNVELKLGPSSECSTSQPSGAIRVT